MKKEVRKEYVVMRCGYYMKEHTEVGMYYTTNNVKQATTFPSIENTISYVENDLKLNIANVSIHEIKTTVTESALVLSEGVYVDINTVEKCVTCGKWFPMFRMNAYRVDLESEREYYCDGHYEEMNSKFANIL